MLERGAAKKNSVSGPFVVESISDSHVHLRTTRNVPDQDVRHFWVRIEHVARCTTVADVQSKLLYTAGLPEHAPPDYMAALHVR